MCCFRSHWSPLKTVPRAWVPNLYCGLNRGKKESGQSLANKTELWDLISDCKFLNLTEFLVWSESQVDREVSQAPWSADLAAQSRMRRVCMVWLVREFFVETWISYLSFKKIRRYRYPKHAYLALVTFLNLEFILKCLPSLPLDMIPGLLSISFLLQSFPYSSLYLPGSEWWAGFGLEQRSSLILKCK